jgi:23S rRNA (cytosine1962-C5)-methyltransferase
MSSRPARAYKDINPLGFRLLNPGGHLMTYSCSGGIGLELFQKIVASAAVDAGRDVRILRRLAAAPDHPVALRFPEGEYLKGLADPGGLNLAATPASAALPARSFETAS